MALLTRIGLAGVGQRSVATDTLVVNRYWTVPSTASNGTSARMMVFTAGNPATTVSIEGSVTCDANGDFKLFTNEVLADGTLRFAFVHAWNGVTSTTSIFGGPCIAHIVSG